MFGNTLQQVDCWLGGLKSVVNYEDTPTETTHASTVENGENEGFLNNSIKQLELILNNKEYGVGE